MENLSLVNLILFSFIFILVYVGANYYVGLKCKRILQRNLNHVNKIVYWIVFWFISLSYIISFCCRKSLPQTTHYMKFLTILGLYWLLIFFYLLIIFLLMDFLIKPVYRKTDSTRLKTFLKKFYMNGLGIFFFIIFVLVLGQINASTSRITNYTLNINKKVKDFKSLNIAMVSDIHMGIGIKDKNLDKMVKKINNLKPDIIFLVGDIIDENTNTSLKKYMSKSFKKFKSKYGVYAVLGNHEYVEGNLNETEQCLKNGNVVLLKDKTVNLNNDIYIIGRKDFSCKSCNDGIRKSLPVLLQGVDKSKPLIVLDHQPAKLDEPRYNNIDLQLSGHTHKGQFFPLNIITKFAFKTDYGYLKLDDLNLIVSSGYGSWGPPIRIGSRSEIVNIKLNFD